MADFELPVLFEIITAIGVIYAILRGIQSDSKDRGQKFSEMLERYDSELQKVMDREDKLKTEKPDEERCERFATDYLNILDRVSYLRQLNKIDDDLIFYFDNYFAYGKIILKWKYDYLQEEHLTRERYPNAVWWIESSFNKNRLKEYQMSSLPIDMKILYNQKVSTEKQIITKKENK